LICGAYAEDVLAIGFDEGPRHPSWIEEMRRRNIAVKTGVCRDQAQEVLSEYQRSEGVIYNARQG